MLTSSVDRDVNGGPVGRNWLRWWFKTLNLSFTFTSLDLVINNNCFNFTPWRQNIPSKRKWKWHRSLSLEASMLLPSIMLWTGKEFVNGYNTWRLANAMGSVPLPLDCQEGANTLSVKKTLMKVLGVQWLQCYGPGVDWPSVGLSSSNRTASPATKLQDGLGYFW